jgi:quercetin dioxygenase-like cupin family protein
MLLTHPSVLSPADGEKFFIGPLEITARVLGSQNGGSFELYELALGPVTVDYHVHQHMDETIVVLEGEIEFIVDGETFLRPSGSVAFIPRGIHHGFCNRGPGRARVLIHFSPAGEQQEYFRELERLFAAPEMDNVAILALQKRYDQELIRPGH